MIESCAGSQSQLCSQSSESVGLSWSSISFSCIVHLLFLVTTIYITVIFAQYEYSLFIWHPICLTLGCCLLMTEATFAIYGEAILVSKVSRSGRVRIHWILHILGFGLMVAGLGASIAHRMQHNVSDNVALLHKRLGLLGIILTVVIILSGTVCVKTKLLCDLLSLRCLKIFHISGGFLCTILLFAGQITGIYSGWWPASELSTHITSAAYGIGGFLLLSRPFHTILLKIRGTCT